MDNQQPVQEQQVQFDQEGRPKKEEHYDELDFIGGALFKMLQNLFLSIKHIVVPKKVE